MGRKVVLVTGGSSGIGRAICTHLLQEGVTIYGTSRKVENGDVRNGIPFVKLDLNNPESISNAIDYLIQKEGRIDVLVNNAGTGISGAVEDTSLENFQSYFNTQVFGMMTCCKTVIPHMRNQGSGQIINISSIAGEFGLPFRGLYSASKSAVNRLSETMRMELEQWGIHVSIIQPGDFKTNINDSRIIVQGGHDPKSPYYKAFKSQYEHISEEVGRGKNPAIIGKLVWKIINSRHPKPRYIVGTFDQNLAILFNFILPKRWFQKILQNRYPLK